MCILNHPNSESQFHDGWGTDQHTVWPKSLDPFHQVSYYIKCGTNSWTESIGYQFGKPLKSNKNKYKLSTTLILPSNHLVFLHSQKGNLNTMILFFQAQIFLDPSLIIVGSGSLRLQSHNARNKYLWIRVSLQRFAKLFRSSSMNLFLLQVLRYFYFRGC